VGTLYKLSVLVSPREEERTLALLEEMFERSACVETDLERGTTHVSLFLDEPPERRKLKEALPHFSVRRVPEENWAESWKRHFRPIEIGSKLLIKPSWSRRKPKRDQAVVVLDPGLSFGTGQHPTTRFCLEQIVSFRRAKLKQSFLDVGTGSGILAIAAAELGYAPVHAFDFDPVAVRIARANAASNGVRDKVRLVQKDIANETKTRSHDLICANLLADLLIAQHQRLASWLKPYGLLVIAGILTLQFREVQRTFEGAGLRLIASATEKEWRSGAFSPRQNFPKK
jgi:ribosomal protein L11 methyltransferase